MTVKILIIEDEPDIADFIKRGLVIKGFDVEVAHTGQQGLELAFTNYPDVVVLDLMLPDKDGIDICRELRSNKEMGIIILTARSQVGERIRGLDAGADDYLSKPFVFEELMARNEGTEVFIGLPHQLAQGQCRDALIQVMNVAFPAGLISVEDAAAQMDAACYKP